MVYKRRTRKHKRNTRHRGGVNTLQPQPLRTQTEPVKYENTLEATKALIQQQEGIPENQERLVFQGVPESDAPTLKSIENKASQVVYMYLKKTLRQIADGDLHRQYTSEARIATEYVFVLSQIQELLNKEINDIQTTYQSGDFVFGPLDQELVLDQLTQYRDYFTKNAYPRDRVNIEYHEALFE